MSHPALALEAVELSLGYDDTAVFTDLNLGIAHGTITTLIGANGSGKSTLLKAFGRLLPAQAGHVRLSGTPIGRLSARAVARELAILPQKPLTPAATSVRDLVMRGRHPHQSLLKPWTPADAHKVAAAIDATGLGDVADRDVNSLSGGQLQRAWIALVLAQETPTILLDEPTTFLDLAHQLDVLRLVRDINNERGSTIVMVLHDLGLAARYSDRLVVVHEGGILADGAPWDVLTPEVLRLAFGLEALVIPDPSTGTPLVVPVEPLLATRPMDAIAPMGAITGSTAATTGPIGVAMGSVGAATGSVGATTEMVA